MSAKKSILQNWKSLDAIERKAKRLSIASESIEIVDSDVLISRSLQNFKKAAVSAYAKVDLSDRLSIDTGTLSHPNLLELSSPRQSTRSIKVPSNTHTTGSLLRESRVTLEVLTKLSEMEVIGVISVLETCVDQLNIITHTNNKPLVIPNLNYKTLSERFENGVLKETLIDLETDLPREATYELMNKKKIQGDCAFLEAALSRTVTELKEVGTYHNLSNAVIQDMLVSIEEDEVLQQEKENSAEVEYLKNRIVEDGNTIAEELNQADLAFAKIKDDIQDCTVQNDLEIKYVENWENARQEQQILKLSMKESDLQDQLVATKIDIDIETRVNHEIKDYIMKAQEILLQQIESWTEKSTQELEERNIQLQLLNAERDEHNKKLEALENVYKRRESEIQEYLAIKEEKQQKEAHIFHLNSMATHIQSWWRGVMVRRGLGPYRKKRKGKDKDKNKKGKGGKKK